MPPLRGRTETDAAKVLVGDVIRASRQASEAVTQPDVDPKGAQVRLGLVNRDALRLFELVCRFDGYLLTQEPPFLASSPTPAGSAPGGDTMLIGGLQCLDQSAS